MTLILRSKNDPHSRRIMTGGHFSTYNKYPLVIILRGSLFVVTPASDRSDSLMFNVTETDLTSQCPCPH